MTPTPSLSDAIAAANTALAAYAAAQQKQQQDAAEVTQIQSELTAAQQTVSDDQTAVQTPGQAAVDALNTVIVSAQAQIATITPPAAGAPPAASSSARRIRTVA